MSAPIKHTCPDIDNLLRLIKGYVSDVEYYASQIEDVNDSKGCKRLASDISDIKWDLEDLRKSNETLRKWGEEEEDRANGAETEIGRLEEKVNELTEEINELKQSQIITP